MTNQLYYGDNLQVLRASVATESVDLVYLDPPFNSQTNYNVLFKAPSGEQSKAQIEAFEDTWHWNDHAENAFDEVMKSGNSEVAEMLRALRSFPKENDMMAYLTMMAIRLLELHRVLTGFAVVVPTGTNHNIINTGSVPLKLYTLYAPPNHRDGVVHHTREDAEADNEHFDGKTTE